MDQKISQLTALTTADQADVYAIVDTSATETKKITQDNLEDTIANSTNFVDELVGNSYFTTELANDANFVNELTSNSSFQSAVNNFVTTGSGSGSGVGRQYIIDDFTSTFISGSSGPSIIGISGNFNYTARFLQEQNHPGVISVNSTSEGINGFSANSTNLGRLFDNDFDVIVYSRVNYGGSLSRAGTIGIIGNNGNEVSINFDLTASANYSYSVNGSATTSSIAIPASGTYVEHRFLYEAGVLTIYAGSTILYTGSVAFNNATSDARSTKIVVGRTGANTGTFEIATDWVKTWSALTPSNGGGSSGTTISATAEQDIVAGQPVGLSASLDDKVALALITKYINANLIGSATGLYNMCEIAQDKYVVLYEQPTDFPVAFVAKIDRATMSVSVGNQVTFGQGGAKVAKLDTDKYVILGYLSGPQAIRDEVYNVSGVTSTSAGTNNYGSSGISGSPNSITSAGTDRIVYARRDQFTPTGSKMVAITYSGATGSAGTAVTLDANAGSIYTVSYLDTNTVMTVQNSTLGASTSIPCNVYTLTGNSFGSGTGTSIGTVGSNSSRGVGVSVVSPGVFLLRAQRTTAPVFSNLYLCHLSGSSIITDQTSTTDSDAISGNLTPIGVSGKVYETCFTGVTATNRINEITVSGTSFTKKVVSIGITLETAPLILLDSTSGYYYATNFKSSTEISTNIQGMSNNFIGIAQSTATRGSTLNVLIKGVDTNQTNLSAGNTYVVSNGAFVITGDPTLPNKGVAKSATSIEI